MKVALPLAFSGKITNVRVKTTDPPVASGAER
jgi:hypothetical protein